MESLPSSVEDQTLLTVLEILTFISFQDHALGKAFSQQGSCYWFEDHGLGLVSF